MSGSVRILLFGNDSHLLKSRQWVFESAGYEVYAATSILALNHILASHPANLPIDLMILCHSLTAEECNRARLIGRAHFPKMEVVILAVNGCVSHTADGDSVVDTAEGPRTLLETVGDLAKKQPGRWAASSGTMPRSKYSV
jgi:hypothetical protein